MSHEFSSPRRERLFLVLAVVSVIALSIGVALRLTQKPNQLVAIAVGLSTIAFGPVPAILRERLREARGSGRKVALVAGAGGAVLVPFAIAAGRTLEHSAWLAMAGVVGVVQVVHLSMDAIRAKEGRTLRYVEAGGWAAVLALVAAATPVPLEQSDRSYQPVVASPRYARGAGPVVCVDEGHHNVHTLGDRFEGFGRLVAADGYRPVGFRGGFEPEALAGCRVLVVASARHESNVERSAAPTLSAFTPAEVEGVTRWVREGGSLLLLVDHMPLSGGARSLGSALGFELRDGFAVTDEPLPGFQGELRASFSRAKGTLVDHPAANGNSSAERVETVLSFGGSGFAVPSGAQGVLMLEPSYAMIRPAAPFVFDGQERVAVAGLAQGATAEIGRGRVAVFAEIAMFTSQLALGLSFMPYGINAPEAPHNAQFAVNVVRWLDPS